MNLGYSCIWPKGEDPYFLLPNGSICPLVTKGDVPYLYPGNSQCQPKTSKKTRCFACAADTSSSEKQCKDVKTSVAFTAAPADDPVQPVGDEPIPVDIAGILTEAEADRVLPEGAKVSLREEALSLHHQLRHKPKNPYCDTCRR